MEGSLRSDGRVRKKGSSGCLIVKKKDQKSSSSVKKKKRERVLVSDSGSSDELLETMRRKARGKGDKGGVGLKRREGGDENFERRGEVEKKSGLDLFEFDEYDEFEGFIGGDEYSDGDNKSKRGRKRGGSSRTSEENIRLQGKNGVLKVTVNSNSHNKKKKIKTDLFCDDSEKEHEENRKSSRSEVVVRKKENLQNSCNSESKQLEKRKSNVTSEKEVSKTGKPLMGKSNADDDLDLDGTDTSLKRDSPSLPSNLIKEERRSSTENLCSPRGKEKDRLSESITPVRGKKETRFRSESSTPPKEKEGKVVGGGSTDKQQLRETIREMLIEAGWTIDYRPRRNRDYLDAVYIHPGGTTYWSITKAYEALQRQFDDQQGRSKSAGISSSFVPISEDLISKLTRQTQRKIEQKMKKRREDGMPKTTIKSAKEESVDAMDSDQPEETLSSFIRQKRKSLKNKTHDLCHENGSESMDYSCKKTTKGEGLEKSSGDTKNRLLQGRLGSVIERCTLRIRDLNKSQNSGSDGYVAYSGKRTVLAWLIESGIVQLGKKVQYMNHRRTRVRLEGWITKEGIHCGCCSKIVTVPKFELHAGSKLGRPFQNIFLESGVSLLQCQIDAWNKKDESEHQDFYTVDMDGDDPDDDTCGICGDGGDLICCDSCPSTFHQSCLEIKTIPLGDWHCPHCVCKFCGTANLNDAGCDSSGDKLTTCSFCERKYHKQCSTDNGTTPMDSSTRTTQFCGHKCEELYDHVWKIIGVKHELETGFSWSLIRRTNIDSDVANSGFAKRVECNSKLAVARSVMDECFLPIIDRRSGINLIHNVLYNSGANFPRLNYGSFYTAILERGDDIISVACIRIHGTDLAEMPFIGTRHIYRRQGMCTRLLSAIELALSSFKVEKLIIPAISEHTSTWTTSFGFSPLEKDLKKDIKSVNMVVFPGTDMLQKQLTKNVTNDAKAIDLNVKHCQPPALTRKSSSLTSGDDENERKKNLDNFEVDCGSLDSAALSNSTSNSGIQSSAVKTASGRNNQVVESASGSILSSSLSAPSITLFDLEKPGDPLNKDSIQSFTETPPVDQPAGTIKFAGEELYSVPKDNEVADAQVLAEMDGKDSVTSGADVNIQSTPCEAKTKDHDIADSSDNVRTDVNGISTISKDGIEKQRLSFNTDLNKPGVNVNEDVVFVSVAEVATAAEVVGVKDLTNTTLVDGMGNHGDSNVGTACFENTNASAISNASEEINGRSDFSCSAGGGPINSESCVEQSEMKSEPHKASTLSCNVNAPTISNISSNAEQDRKYSSVQALPDSSNVCSPHGAVEVHKNQETISLSAFHGSTQNTVSFGAIPVGCHDLNSTVISGDDTDPSALTIHSNGKDKVISDEIVPMKLQPDHMEKAI